MAEAHRRTLDQLSSGVAVFDGQRRLAFYNDSYRRLWDLDRTFLDGNPDDSSVLDRLRAARKLPEQADFRAWKAKLHEAYRAVEPEKDTWYLPDGRAVSVVTTPNPEGGVTYLFDDVTESLDLARRFDGLIRVQRETLDSLAEASRCSAATAARGCSIRPSRRCGDCRPKRCRNSRISRPWKPGASRCSTMPTIWQTMREAITAIENRVEVPLKLERKDGSVLDCTTMPLPDGATMLTFQDITDTENVERALRERNEALETADQMKIDFVHHVSYELRSPLTTIIGFAHFLSDPVTGPLMPKQARVSRLHHHIDQRAARDHQQHPRSRHHRRRRDVAQSGPGRYPQDHRGRGGRHPGPARHRPHRAPGRRRSQHRQLRWRRTPRGAGALQSAGQRRRIFAAGYGRCRQRRAQRTQRRVLA